MRSVLKHGNLTFGAILFSFIIIAITLVGPFLSPYSPTEPNWGEVTLPPGGGHLLGTDKFGRDVLTRILYGGRITVMVALAAQILNSIVGISFGLVAGYFGGKLDDFVMGLVNVLLALPPLILGLAILVVGPSILSVVAAIGFTYWTYTCRLTRSRVLSIKAESYVESAKAVGG